MRSAASTSTAGARGEPGPSLPMSPSSGSDGSERSGPAARAVTESSLRPIHAVSEPSRGRAIPASAGSRCAPRARAGDPGRPRAVSPEVLSRARAEGSADGESGVEASPAGSRDAVARSGCEGAGAPSCCSGASAAVASEASVSSTVARTGAATCCAVSSAGASTCSVVATTDAAVCSTVAASGAAVCTVASTRGARVCWRGSAAGAVLCVTIVRSEDVFGVAASVRAAAVWSSGLSRRDPSPPLRSSACAGPAPRAASAHTAVVTAARRRHGRPGRGDARGDAGMALV